ncbi:hypothetical protein MANES_S023253v8 [Manihot esculenta]|uniref:Uncharacterized protein n=1 Tax=Manihot esculenta TaxID=3983 RepID=A0ACB7FVE4_MANES|nr:hypothetical protein MANES_S023253v8 [Manihot esculenta]
MLHPVPDFGLIASIPKTAKSITHVTSGARFRPNSFHPKNCQVYHPCYIRCPISPNSFHPKTAKSITHVTSGARFRLIASIPKTAKSITHVTSGARFRPNSFHPKNCQVYHPCYIRCPISA